MWKIFNSSQRECPAKYDNKCFLLKVSELFFLESITYRKNIEYHINFQPHHIALSLPIFSFFACDVEKKNTHNMEQRKRRKNCWKEKNSHTKITSFSLLFIHPTTSLSTEGTHLYSCIIHMRENGEAKKLRDVDKKKIIFFRNIKKRKIET